MTSTTDSHPTLLRTPSRYDFPNERILPGNVGDYITEEDHQGWRLVVTIEEGLVYFGPGPASVVRSPAPFYTVSKTANDPEPPLVDFRRLATSQRKRASASGSFSATQLHWAK